MVEPGEWLALFQGPQVTGTMGEIPGEGQRVLERAPSRVHEGNDSISLLPDPGAMEKDGWGSQH